jgi:hypothetical protein
MVDDINLSRKTPDKTYAVSFFASGDLPANILCHDRE